MRSLIAYRVECADRETGKPYYLKIEAESEQQARDKAAQAGHLAGAVLLFDDDGNAAPKSALSTSERSDLARTISAALRDGACRRELIEVICAGVWRGVWRAILLAMLLGVLLWILVAVTSGLSRH